MRLQSPYPSLARRKVRWFEASFSLSVLLRYYYTTTNSLLVQYMIDCKTYQSYSCQGVFCAENNFGASMSQAAEPAKGCARARESARFLTRFAFEKKKKKSK